MVPEFAAPVLGCEKAVSRMLAVTGVRPDQTVAVVGSLALDALADLCRRGFRRVELARQATCRAADEPADVLFVADACPERARRLLGVTFGVLVDGGAAVVDVGTFTVEERAELAAAMDGWGRGGALEPRLLWRLKALRG